MDKTVEAIRIVTIDYYMSKPIQGLDSVYSELQNTVIKQVPIIRIFGSNKEGIKVCSHVHGVFPYFYVPYDDSAVENTTKYIQQLANSLDKAINISLGKFGSKQQYVFKVSLVKGIPFYGYHNDEEQFLKIYLYHPGLIRRTANLLLNGAIMGKSFQPHETHIPYILQFMIDHNLYGMSQLLIPSELLLYRGNDESLPKLSLSALEFDFMAIHILNRALLYQKSDTNHVNPGITSIWEDEKIRRGVQQISELEPPSSQFREYREISDTDKYYRQILKHKLTQIEMSEPDLNCTDEMERLFVMSSPAEDQSTNNLVQSKVQGSSQHSNKSSQSSSLFSLSTPSNTQFPEVEEPMDDMNDTIVNEELVLNLTQNRVLSVSLHEEDYELLNIMQELEENDGQSPDNDSVLAPCTQLPKSYEIDSTSKIIQEQSLLTQIDKEIEGFDEGNEDELDFTIANINDE